MYFATLNPIAEWLRESMESQGVECFSCDCRSRPTYPLGLVRLARFLRRRKIDILHTHLFEPSVIGLWAGVLARTPVRIVTRHYSDYHTRINKRWHVRLDQMCTRLAHTVIAVSQHTADHLIEREQAPPERVQAIHNGIDFDRVRVSGPLAVEQIRREFVPDGADLLLTVGRIHPEKGYDYLFPAVKLLKERLDRRFLLVVAGTGPLLDHYRQVVRDLGCDDVVRFLGFRRDIADLIAAADLFVLPSLAEAFGLAVAEALYLGTPVVATRTGGIPEIVTDGKDGVLVPPADSQSLAIVIADLLRDAPRRRQMAGAGCEQIARRFRFQDMVQNYEQVYRRLTGASESSADADRLRCYSHV